MVLPIEQVVRVASARKQNHNYDRVRPTSLNRCAQWQRLPNPPDVSSMFLLLGVCVECRPPANSTAGAYRAQSVEKVPKAD